MASQMMTRSAALRVLAAAALIPAGCGGKPASVIKVGSKNFTEELLLGEMYSLALERAGYNVERRLNLGSTQIAMEAMQRGEIDLYPEYTGTALVVQLKLAPMSDRRKVFDLVKAAYIRQYDMTWLDPAPMNDMQALATTQAVAAKYGLRTLSECSRLAPRLRLGAGHEFIERPDGLPGLQRAYGGFHFASVKITALGLKYKALLAGDVDVALAFGTDGEIDADKLVVLDDDRHFFPPYQVAPVVRTNTLTQFPKIPSALNALSPFITDATMRRLNWRVDGNKEEPADVARDFVTQVLANPATT
ncbi:MAG TPA: glycine betaine ABC transporter substrate-binding protein [Candidatus Eremiobacteraceae bacterium]